MDHRPVEPSITELLYGEASAKRIPLSGTFELTPLCNMDCKMCYVRMSRKEQEAIAPLRSAKEWINLGKRLAEAGMLYLLLTGGEPLTHPEFPRILRGLSAQGLVLSLNTNGTLLTPEAVSLLRECGVMRVSVSLYGMSGEAYRDLCGDASCFEKTLRGIALLKASGIGVKLNFSITPQNKNELPLVAEYARKENLVLQVASYMFPPLRRDNDSAGRGNRLSPEEAAYYCAFADLLTLGKERFLAFDTEHFAPPSDEVCTTPDGVRCRAGKCSFWVTWQGILTPCGMFPAEGENVLEAPFLPAWERLVKQVDGIRLPAKCAACGIRGTCRACAATVLTESGDFSRVPEYRCRMMQAYPEAWKQIKEKFL